jgi:glycosyltransferase involved in cell wall biosynthesis
MRIGLISYEYPPQQGLGGVGTYMFRLAGALGRVGHQVHVITGPSDRAPVEQPGVVIHRIAAEFNLRQSSRLVRWLYWQIIAHPLSRSNPMVWHWLKWNLASLEAIRRIDAAHRLDLVEAPEHAGNGWMAGLIHRWPLVLRMHCPWDLFVRVNRLPPSPLHRLMSGLERWTICRYADCITVPSLAMQRVARGNWKLRRPPRVIPNFMDVPPQPAPLPDDAAEQRIVCTGRIEPLKGQDTLARAFSLLAPRQPRAHLWIIGPDRWPGRVPFHRLLQRIVPDPTVRSRIHMPGLVPLDTIVDQLRRARVAVIASIGFESFSYSCLEAMAAARPTVITNTGGLPELITHEKQGLVVSPADEHEMAAAIERFLDDRELSRQLALAAHATALARYDTRHVLPTMLDAYRDAADYYHRNHAVVPHSLIPGPHAISDNPSPPPAQAGVARIDTGLIVNHDCISLP